MPSVCEVRIPTYKRPALLRRALGLLSEQTEQNFHCVIFDDSPEGEAADIVEAFPGLRIELRRNPRRLGITGNLEQCFRTGAYLPADHCFCLEDDNIVFPEFIAENIRALDRYGTNIAVSDQCIESLDGRIDCNRTTMGGLLFEGVNTPADLLLSIFLGGGLSNGGLFWRSTARSELAIGDPPDDPVLLEYLRPLAISEDVVFLPRPLGAWRDNGATSFRIESRPLKRRSGFYRRLATVAHLRRSTLPALLAGRDMAAVLARIPESRKARFELSVAGVPRLFRPAHAPVAAVAKRWLLGAALRVPGLSSVREQAIRDLLGRTRPPLHPRA